MSKPSLEERAKNNPQLSRILEKGRRKAEAREAQRKKQKGSKPYAENHLPETPVISDEAAAALSSCVLPKSR